MYSPSLFVTVHVVLLITCVNPSAALVVGDRYGTPTKNKTISAHPASRPDPPPRRTRAKHVMAQSQVSNRRRAVVDPLSNTLDAYLNDLGSNYDIILAASKAFSSSAQTSRTNVDDSSRQDATAKLASYKQTLGPLYPLMANIGADHGVANYDSSDQYETLLKGIVNVNKFTLGNISRLIDADPLLGPMLGPIVYDIKCILDELLDCTENTTNDLFNSITPLLKSQILSAAGTVCRSIPSVDDLC